MAKPRHLQCLSLGVAIDTAGNQQEGDTPTAVSRRQFQGFAVRRAEQGTALFLFPYAVDRPNGVDHKLGRQCKARRDGGLPDLEEWSFELSCRLFAVPCLRR